MQFLNDALILFAKSSVSIPSGDSKSYSMSWGLVLAGIIVGLLATLSPVHRSAEIKRAKED